MAMIVCPNCGSTQDGGSKCRTCSTLFEYYQNMGAHAAVQATCNPAPVPEKSARSLAHRIYRVVTWGSLAGLLMVVALIFRPQPPPQVASDPKAADRVETKLRESQSAAAAGNPQILRLDESEVNAFLSSNLVLKKEGPQANGAGGASAPSNPAPVGSTSSPAPAEREPTLEEVQSSVKDVKINILEDRVQAYVLFDFHGKDMSLVLEGRLHAEDGYLRFEPISGKLGSLPIPQSTLVSAVQRMLSSPENREKMRLPPDVADVQIKNGELVVVPRNN